MNKKVSLKNVNSKSELINLQRAFAEIIRRPLITNQFMQEDSRTSQIIAPNEFFTEHERLQFYARQYWWRIQAAFEEDFPSVRNLLKKSEYKKLKAKYLNDFPSVSYTLRNLGSRFPDFIKIQSDLENRELVYNAALYDWARIDVFDAPDFRPLSDEQLSLENIEKQNLKLQPFVKLLELNYPIHEINKSDHQRNSDFSSNTLNQDLDHSKEETEKINEDNSFDLKNIASKKTYLAIHRLDRKIYAKVLRPEEFVLLEALQTGLKLEDLASLSLDCSELKIQQYFTEFRALNWIYLET